MPQAFEPAWLNVLLTDEQCRRWGFHTHGTPFSTDPILWLWKIELQPSPHRIRPAK